MRARRVFIISAALGAIVLLPVLLIVTLGIYGTSIGGSTSARGASGARITLLPASGVPGDSVTIQGRGWPPKSEITIYVARQDESGQAAGRLRLGKIEASRAGAFELRASVPRHLVAPGADQIFFQAEAEGVDGDRVSVRPISFALIPYSNALRIAVSDAVRGIPLDGVLIEVHDPLGQLVTIASTDRDGALEITGIVPGEYTLAAAKIDYQAGEKIQIVMPEEGVLDIDLSLRHLPGRRLFGLAFEQFEGGPPMVGGLDRASGLAVQESLTVPIGRLGPVADTRSGVYYEFLLGAEGHEDQDLIYPLLAVAAAGRLAAGYGAGNPTITVYAGESATGTVVLSTSVGFVAGQSTAIVTLDFATGRVIYRREVPRTSLIPLLSADGTRMFVGDWLTGRIRVLDAANGDTLVVHRGVVEAVRQLILDGEGGLLVLEDVTGAVRALDPVTGALGEPLLVVPFAKGMALGNNGELLLIGSDRRELIVADPDTGELLGIVALQFPAGFIWPDPGGSFLIIGYRESRQKLTLQVLDPQTYETIRTLELPLD